MTAEQLAEENYPKCDSPSLITTIIEDDIIERERQAYIAGYNDRQPQIDALKERLALWEKNKETAEFVRQFMASAKANSELKAEIEQLRTTLKTYYSQLTSQDKAD